MSSVLFAIIVVLGVVLWLGTSFFVMLMGFTAAFTNDPGTDDKVYGFILMLCSILMVTSVLWLGATLVGA